MTVTEIMSMLYHLADIVREYEAIMNQPDCNNCSEVRRCRYAPDPGQRVRINCPHWQQDYTEEA